MENVGGHLEVKNNGLNQLKHRKISFCDHLVEKGVVQSSCQKLVLVIAV